MHHPADRIAHTRAFVTAEVVHQERSDDPSLHEQTTELHRTPIVWS